MEMDLEPRVKPLLYKIKGMSRESPSQKANHVLDTDLRTHWSTGTNTKEWILLELDESCLLSHIRIHNKSVLEWEIAVGLRYKPEAFVKVRPRCEAPRRDMLYPMNYTPCRFVRISCLRGNPIAIFFIQLIGVSVAGLEPELQPVVNYLLPHIISHKQEAHDMHLQLLQDIASRLLVFLPQLETDLVTFSESPESVTRFFAMLAGPFYPILHLVNERSSSKSMGTVQDSDVSRTTQGSTLTVSSNFEVQPRRSRNSSSFAQYAASSIAFRPDVVFTLLRKAHKDPHLRNVCRIACRALQKLTEPTTLEEFSLSSDVIISSDLEETSKTSVPTHVSLTDYSSLFGEDLQIPDDHWDSSYLILLDIGATEEGILHVLYACAAQPSLCCILGESNSYFFLLLPLIQALLPALRPPVGSPPYQVDEGFIQWSKPFVQRALSQIVTTSSSAVYHPLLSACAGYLSSCSQSHAKAACVLIDLCSGPLHPWISMVIAKMDLAIELLEDLLGSIQGANQSIDRAHAALKYIILALSGHVDDKMAKFKEVKHKLLFLLEMLEPFFDLAMIASEDSIEFVDASAVFLEKQKQSFDIALNIIRTAVSRAAVLPSLESEWRRGSAAPSVLLSILGPHMLLPPNIDLCKCPSPKMTGQGSTIFSSGSSVHDSEASKSDGQTDVSEALANIDVFEDASLLFAPVELKRSILRKIANLEVTGPEKSSAKPGSTDGSKESKCLVKEFMNDPHRGIALDYGFAIEYFNLQADYLQLVNYSDRESRASEFQRLALDLHSEQDIKQESHDAAIDALLLAAECYLNPFFMTSSTVNKFVSRINSFEPKALLELKQVSVGKNINNLETISHIERKRDKVVLQLLLQAAELDKEYQKRTSAGEQCPYDTVHDGQGLELFPPDVEFADAVTLIRQNQALLCQFIMQCLRRKQHSMHEILLQSLLFLLHSATELFCPPEDIIDVILGSAEHLNRLVASAYHELKVGNQQLDLEKLYTLRRRWILLQKLVLASTGTDEGTHFAITTKGRLHYRSLVPPSSWMQSISKFSSCSASLVRFVGWMAVSQYGKQYMKERLFLTSDLSQLTCLLSIFLDELAMVENKSQRDEESNSEKSGTTEESSLEKESELSNKFNDRRSIHIIYPELHKFFPNIKHQFRIFGDIILEAVGLQLKSLPSSAVPDVLCWFAGLCLWPSFKMEKNDMCNSVDGDHLKGYTAVNAKAIVLYILEAIISEHMEAMLPEMPRVVQILLSLCKASYCDVIFLDSVLRLVKPLFSYALGKASESEKLVADESSCLTFESSCFDELFTSIRCRNENQEGPGGSTQRGALVIYILGSLFPDLSSLRREEIMQSLLLWADFTISERTSSIYDYLCAFQNFMESCKALLQQTIGIYGIGVPVLKDQFSGTKSFVSVQKSATENSGNFHEDSSVFNPKAPCLSKEEIVMFSTGLEGLISKLNPTIELCWTLHCQLAKNLALISAECYMFSRYLKYSGESVTVQDDTDGENVSAVNPSDKNSNYWRTAVEEFSETIIRVQQNHCWQVASVMLDFVLGLPRTISLDTAVGALSSSFKHFCCHAPKVSWRLQSDRWLSSLLSRHIIDLHGHESQLMDFFCTMLSHPEPEQRSVALEHLGRLFGLDLNGGIIISSHTIQPTSFASDSGLSVPDSILSLVVSCTWDRVAGLASADPSISLRTLAMALLSGYIPFAEHSQIQSFLMASDTILCGLCKSAYPMQEGPLLRLSLCLLVTACLYSAEEDIGLIPLNIWKSLENVGMSKTGGIGDLEKRASRALLLLRIDWDDGKEVLKEVLSLNDSAKHSDPNFKSTREEIIQVLASLTSVQSYFDFFSMKSDQDALELEEAEIELDLLQREKASQEVLQSSKEDVYPHPPVTTKSEDITRLQQIKDEIRSLEKSKLREEIAARRQKTLLARQMRQKYLEETALREMELLQNLDREKTSEMENEIERQLLLELERAKTRELRHNLDMERERQTQRELQRELEQAESGVRSSRREFSSSNSRPRERYRERENGRPGHDGSSRPSSRGRESVAAGQSSTSSGVPPIPHHPCPHRLLSSQVCVRILGSSR
ncbi:hypothetical protein QJS10_CPA01g03048 [Acorus calamus]|uniref:Uncharacterized protein n=1 Tax=Acorus calamus TaxID=4465 RepID=A0AAV9FEP6_ACOCL|nr:hypothetical protein QJS10_CPA01g03048 [Acorus calamus]